MTSGCPINLLESSLAGSLPTADQAALDRHLDECEACGETLERLAGWAAWCEEAALLLTEDELDELHPMREDWAVDFTVEHLEPTDEPDALGRLGDFDVLEIIGHGGMGVVLKAHDRKLNRRVAIKVLSPHLAQNSLARKRFASQGAGGGGRCASKCARNSSGAAQWAVALFGDAVCSGGVSGGATDGPRDVGAQGDAADRDAGRGRSGGGA